MAADIKSKRHGFVTVILSFRCPILWENPNLTNMPASAAQFQSMCSVAVTKVGQQLLILETDALGSNSLGYLEKFNDLLLELNDTDKLSILFESVHSDSGVRNIAEVCTQQLDKLRKKINLSKPLYNHIKQMLNLWLTFCFTLTLRT
jgi:Zn-dependent oligopeptidase